MLTIPIATAPTVSDLQRRLRSLETDLENERSALAEERRRREHLEWKLKELQAKLFGKSSEKIHPDQLQLILEGLEAAAAFDTAPELKWGWKRSQSRSVLIEAAGGRLF